MLAQPSLSSFIESTVTAKVLPTGLLPLNNNSSLIEIANFHTATVVDEDGKTPVGFGVMNQCNSKQAYCMLGRVADKYKRNAVDVKEITEQGETKNTLFQVVSSMEGVIEKHCMRPYTAVFADDEKRLMQHVLMDTLLEQTIGTFNMDMEKNVTIDILGEEKENTDIWRDHSGFLVDDANKIVEITADKQSFLDVFTEEAGECEVTINAIDKNNVADVLDFDEGVSLYSRAAYLNYLIGHSEIKGFLASSAPGSAAGYILSSDDRILQCYAETSQIAAKLFAAAGSAARGENVTFFGRPEANAAIDALRKKAAKVQDVFRLHTRTKQVQVKWALVHAVNVGISVV